MKCTKNIFSGFFFSFSNKMSNITNNQLYLLYGVQYKGGVIFFFLARYLWNILSVSERWMADIECVCLRRSDIFDSTVWRWLLFYRAFFVWEKIEDVPNGTWYLALNTCFFYFSDKNTFTRPTKCYIFFGSSNISFHWCFWWDVTRYRFMNFGSRTFSCR